jgi:hypothetical protein
VIVVLDTNVIISGLLSSTGSPAEIIRHWEAGDFEAVVSPALLSELDRALKYPRVAFALKLSEQQTSEFLRGYALAATHVAPYSSLDEIADDPGDNHVLECAVEGNADIIVSGDKHLLHLKEYHGIVILSPAEFLALLTTGDRDARG